MVLLKINYHLLKKNLVRHLKNVMFSLQQGVSVGDADHVKTALENLGKIKFWKISVKPGNSAYGKINKCAFFGLPGNPVSVVVTFNLFVHAAINKLCGRNYENHLLLEAELIDDIKKEKVERNIKEEF